MNRRRTALACAVVLLLPFARARTAHAVIDAITIAPSSPTTADSIAVTVDGHMYDGCWSFDHVGTPLIGGRWSQFIFVSSSTVDTWTAGATCDPDPVPYRWSVRLPPLAPGLWSLSAFEYLTSQRSDTTPWALGTSFTVLPASAAEPATWGRIKNLYAPRSSISPLP